MRLSVTSADVSPFYVLQIAFMTLTLFPIRLFFAAFMMLLAWPFAFVAAMGRTGKELEQPMSWWRKFFDITLKVIMRTMWFAGGFHWVTVKGRQALPAEASILTLAPHSSYFDAIPVTMTMASIVMKAESKDIPVWGTLINYIRPVFVSRSDQDSRKKTVEEIRRRAHSNGMWPQVMIFPEGTCTNRSCLITFKPGAFIPGVPVQPVVLRYPNKMFLPIYTPSEEEKRNPALYASNVRHVMANLKPEKLEKELKQFSESAKKRNGEKINLQEFAEYLSLPVMEKLEDLFALFDEKEESVIDLREYVIALSVVCRPSKTLETIQLAFEMYQSETDKTIVEEELAVILKTALGVSELNVTDLFRAIDEEEKGKITYVDFDRFAALNPHFAEMFLYPNMMDSEPCADSCPVTAPNGFCTDFTPEDMEEYHKEQKKLN
ncbi:hypothetical protein GDO78_012842 [Eleutherodactylus coqui]|uniref:EF-hand domain-containing protein n=1 Tax=Eleutherodactylus coqui TaxID=57060 RepID=A0A8J6F0U4_ELECQ|nr:hypothetical protein GDO78_012842 [Eleutherodactylus coqui]